MKQLACALEGIEKRSLSQDEIDQEFTKIVADVQLVVSRWEMRQRIEYVLRSLHFEQISERSSGIANAHKNTFHWSFSPAKASLASWLQGGQGIYWIEGKAGSGKSTLMKYLVRERRTEELLSKWAAGKSLVVASHFFWGHGTDLQRGFNGLFRTLLFQILLAVPELVAKVCPGRMNQADFRHLESWTIEELVESFKRLAMVDELPAKFCFFIDGLDEFHGDHADLSNMLKSVFKFSDIKICVSSRTWSEFQLAFGQSEWQLHVHELTRDDIETYVDDCLVNNEYYRVLESQSPAETKSFKNEIVTRANGVFLWVYLVTRSLLRGLRNRDTTTTLTHRLRDFPTELEDYFEAMLDSIEPVYWKPTCRMLIILTYQRSPVAENLLSSPGDVLDQVHTLIGQTAQSTEPIDRCSTAMKSSKSDGAFYSKLCEELRALLRSSPSMVETNLVAKGRDLVHYYEPDIDQPNVPKVGFLHRTVSDFLVMPRIMHKLEARFGQTLHPKIALAEAYLPLWAMEKEWEKARTIFLRIAFLLKDVSDELRAYCGRIMLILWLTVLPDSDHSVSPLLHSPIYDSLNRLKYPGMPAMMLLLVATRLKGLPPPVLEHPLEEASVQNLIPGILQYHGILLGGPAGLTTKNSWVNFRLTSLSLKEVTIEVSDRTEPQLREKDETNLEQLSELLDDPLYEKSLQYSDSTSSWLHFLSVLSTLEKDDKPKNLNAVCEMLISHGAPRVTRLDEHTSSLFLKPFKTLTGTTSAEYIDIDTALVLHKLLDISNPNGMADLFVSAGFQPTNVNLSVLRKAWNALSSLRPRKKLTPI